MSSQLNVDTIVDKAGSGGTNVKIGNTSTYVSDGGAVTQNTVEGLAKVWVNFDGSASGATARDSLNVSTMTDRGAGQFTITFATVMGNTNYNSVASATVGGADNYNRMAGAASNATNFSYLNTFAQDGSSSALADAAYTSATFHGDLA